MLDPNKFVGQSGWSSDPDNSLQHFSAKVVKVLDVDTVKVRMGEHGSDIRVRFSGIDGPERSQHLGQTARQYVEKQLLGKTIHVASSGDDIHGRKLGYIYTDQGKLFQADLAARGLAFSSYSQGTRQDAEIAVAEKTAIRARAGVWDDADGLTVRPDTYRHMNVVQKIGYAVGAFNESKWFEARKMQADHAVGDRVVHHLHGVAIQASPVVDRLVPHIWNDTGQRMLLEPNQDPRVRRLAKELGIQDQTVSPAMHLYKEMFRERFGRDPNMAEGSEDFGARTMQEYERLYKAPTVGETSWRYALAGGQLGQRGPISSTIMSAAARMDRAINEQNAQNSMGAGFYRADPTSNFTGFQMAAGVMDGVSNVIMNAAGYHLATITYLQAAHFVREELFGDGSGALKKVGRLRQAQAAGSGLADWIVKGVSMYEGGHNRFLKSIVAPAIQDLMLPAAQMLDDLMGKKGDTGISQFVKEGADILRDPADSPSAKALKVYHTSGRGLMNIPFLGSLNRPFVAFREAYLFGQTQSSMLQSLASIVTRQRTPEAGMRAAWEAHRSFVSYLGEDPHHYPYDNNGRFRGSAAKTGLTTFKGYGTIALGVLVGAVIADFVMGRLDSQGGVDRGIVERVKNVLNPLEVANMRVESDFVVRHGRGDDRGFFQATAQTMKQVFVEPLRALLPSLKYIGREMSGTRHAVAGDVTEQATLMEQSREALAAGNLAAAQRYKMLAMMAPGAYQADTVGSEQTAWSLQLSVMPLLGQFSLAMRDMTEAHPDGGTTTAHRLSFAIQGPVQMEIGASTGFFLMGRSTWNPTTRKRDFEIVWDPKETLTPKIAAFATLYGLYNVANLGHQAYSRIRQATGGGRGARSLYAAMGRPARVATNLAAFSVLPVVGAHWFAFRGIGNAAGYGVGALRGLRDADGHIQRAWTVPSMIEAYEGVKNGQTRGYRAMRATGRGAGAVATLFAVAGVALSSWGDHDPQAATRFLKGTVDGAIAAARWTRQDWLVGMVRALASYFPYAYPNPSDVGKMSRVSPTGHRAGTATESPIETGNWFKRTLLDPLTEVFSIDIGSGKVGPFYLGKGARFVTIGPFGLAERELTRDNKVWGTTYFQMDIPPLGAGSAVSFGRAVSTISRNTDIGRLDTKQINALLAGSGTNRRMLERKGPAVMGIMHHADSAVFDGVSMPINFEVRRREQMANWIRHVDARDVLDYMWSDHYVGRKGIHSITFPGNGSFGLPVTLKDLFKALRVEDMLGDTGVELDYDPYEAVSQDVTFGRSQARRDVKSGLFRSFSDAALGMFAVGTLASIGLFGSVTGWLMWKHKGDLVDALRQRADRVPKAGMRAFGPLSQPLFDVATHDVRAYAPDQIRGWAFTVGDRAYVRRLPGDGGVDLFTVDEIQKLHAEYTQMRGMWERLDAPKGRIIRGQAMSTVIELEGLMHQMETSKNPVFKAIAAELGAVKAYIGEFRAWESANPTKFFGLGGSEIVPEGVVTKMKEARNALRQHLMQDFTQHFGLELMRPGTFVNIFKTGFWNGIKMHAKAFTMGILDETMRRPVVGPVQAGAGPMGKLNRAWDAQMAKTMGRHFGIDDLDDFAELSKIHKQAMGSKPVMNIFDYYSNVRGTGTRVSTAEIDSFQRSFGARFWTTVDLARDGSWKAVKAGSWKFLTAGGKAMERVFWARSAVSLAYLGGGAMDRGNSIEHRTRMGASAMSEAGLLLAGVGGAAAVALGVALLPVALPAMVVTGLAAVASIGAALFFENVVANNGHWKAFAQRSAEWAVSAQEHVGERWNHALAGMGRFANWAGEKLQGMTDTWMNSIMESRNTPVWAKGFMGVAYEFLLSPLSHRAREFYNPNARGSSASVQNNWLRSMGSPIWHGHIRDFGHDELARQERVRQATTSNAMMAIYSPGLFFTPDTDDRFQIKDSRLVGSKRFFRNASLVDEFIGMTMRKRAVDYQMILGKTRVRTESFRQGDQVVTINPTKGDTRIDPTAWGSTFKRANAHAKVPSKAIMDMAIKAGKEFGVPPETLLTIASQESGFNPGAKSDISSARGMMQFIKGTAEGYAKKVGKKGYVHERDAHDPELQLRMAAAYIQDLTKRFGDPVTAVGAYFTGEGNMNKILQGVPVDLGKGNPTPAAYMGKFKANMGFYQGIVNEYQKHGTIGSNARPKSEAGKVKQDSTKKVTVPKAKPKTVAMNVDTGTQQNHLMVGERMVAFVPGGQIVVGRELMIGSNELEVYRQMDTSAPRSGEALVDTCA